MRKKLQTIIDVFIKSHVPPELQIDVPIEIAERLYDKACGRVPQGGPYLFREAQVILQATIIIFKHVFRISYYYKFFPITMYWTFPFFWYFLI